MKKKFQDIDKIYPHRLAVYKFDNRQTSFPKHYWVQTNFKKIRENVNICFKTHISILEEVTPDIMVTNLYER